MFVTLVFACGTTAWLTGSDRHMDDMFQCEESSKLADADKECQCGLFFRSKDVYLFPCALSLFRGGRGVHLMYSPGWPETYYVDKASLVLIEILPLPLDCWD